MLGWLLLTAMVPRTDVPAAEQAPVGEPAPHLARQGARQWQLAQRADWAAFQERWGGQWSARWDERTGMPRFLGAPGIPERQASVLLADVARLAGLDPSELKPVSSVDTGGRRLQRWTRTWRGAEVLGDDVLVVSVAGSINAVWARLSPIYGLPSPVAGEVVLPLPVAGRAGFSNIGSTGVQSMLVRPSEEGAEVVFRDRQGAEVHRYDTRHFAGVEVELQERTVGDPMVSQPARLVTVTDSSGTSEVTAADGTHSLSGELDVALTGPTLVLTDDGTLIEGSGSDDISLVGGVDLPQSGASVQHHFYVVWDWLETRWPEHSWLAQQVPADVEVSWSACNAYYSSGTVNFFPEYPGYCNNLGEVADVIYHEVGHGIHHYILAGGTFAGDISEGSADYVSATINNDAEVGPNSWAGGGYVREIETDKIYPDNISGEVHNDGLVWASFFWNLRSQWRADYGEETGTEMTDLLFLGALQQGPTLTDAYEAVIVADDDDGDLSNGTPHGCELADLLDQHGIGPGAIGVVVFEHDPIEAPGSWEAGGYPVSFQLYDLTPECRDLDSESIAVWYSTDDEALVPGSSEWVDTGAEDTGGADTGAWEEDPWPGWTRLEISTEDDISWLGTIPRQVAGTHVRYFMEAASTDGTELIQTHGGSAAGVYAFWIGDREALWCEGFEAEPTDWTAGAGTPWQSASESWESEWAFGTPAGTGWTPAEAWEGTGVAATNLEGDYRNSNLQYLQSPELLVEEGVRMPMLAYRRWLTVEDGIYDKARLYLGDDLAFSNGASEEGIEHQLDTRWVLHELPLEDRVGEAFRATWTLSSDQGLEFGGWALDQVCITVLDDLPGHYRVRDLVASDEADEVEVSWSTPWILPMHSAVLVKKQGGWPEGPDDGLILSLDTSPEPGEEHSLVDPDVLPGETWYYALFVAGEHAEDWQLEVVEGENADVGGVPAEEIEPPEDDTGDPSVEPEVRTEVVSPSLTLTLQEATGCGCSNTGSPRGGLLWLGILGFLGLRRRRGGEL